MRKLTELDLQNALDECESIKFRTHGDWLAGMVKRLNAAITDPVSDKSAFKITLPPSKKIVFKTGNSSEPEVPCIS